VVDDAAVGLEGVEDESIRVNAQAGREHRSRRWP
jgi:hypothetical protein